MVTLLKLANDDDEGIKSSTRRGRHIRNQQGLKYLPYEEANKRGLLLQGHPYARSFHERKPPTNLYNCHGMTFLNRRSRITDEEEISKIIADDEYSQVNLAGTQPGDIVIYYSKEEITHTGIVVRIEEGVVRLPFILSKWGDYGEYLHPYNKCPYFESDGGIRFMREG